MSTAVIYARFSSDRQRSESIEQQVFACTEYCQRIGIPILRVYEDRALTGRTDARPQFLQMIQDSRRGEFDTVVVYALDRFSRSVYDSCIYEDQLTRHGVRLLSVTEHLSDDPSGILIKQVFRGFAEYYSAELSAKIRRGLDDNARRYLCNGHPAFGFDRGPDGQYVVNESEAAIIKEIFQRVARSDSLASICADLNARGIRTKTGSAWNKSSFGHILTNPRYIGTYVYHGEETPGVLPAIIDEDLFYTVQRILPEKKRARGSTTRRRTPNGIYLLTGKLYCSCGKPMTARAGTSKTGALHFYYVCKGRKSGSGCTQRSIRRDAIEQSVAMAMRDLCLDDDTLRWIAQQAVASDATRQEIHDQKILSLRLSEIKTQKANLMKAILAGIITETTKSMLLNLEQEEKDLTARLAVLSDSTPALTEDDVISFLTLFRSGDAESKSFQQGLLDAFVRRVDLHPDSATVYFRIKKEDRQTVIPLDDPSEVRLSSESGGLQTLNERLSFCCGYFILKISA